MKKHVDYIIVGQGLSGTALIQILHEQNLTFVVIDQPDTHQASRVASGIWNPVVLKRMKKVWHADQMLECLMPFYKRAEALFNASFVKEKKVARLFSAAKEIDEWITISDQPIFGEILNPDLVINNSSGLNANLGLGEVMQSGRVDTIAWLDAARKWLVENDILSQSPFNYDELELVDKGVRYSSIEANGVVFCEGMHAATKNPFFSYLPFALTKGEVLVIRAPQLKLTHIVNSSVFILPLGNNFFKIGATYNWREVDLKRTEEAREELIKKAKRILNVPFEVVEQKVGIRPTVRDRRPLIGTHPKHKQLHIFNGMGSRGVLMAPWLSMEFLKHINKTGALLPEADIARFNRLYS